jgi:hypothetical protein
MWASVLEIFISIVVGLLYFYLVYNSILQHFKRMTNPLNNVLKILFTVTFFGFLLNLKAFITIGIMNFENALHTDNLIKFSLYLPVLALLSFVFSILLFQITVYTMKMIRTENVKIELIKNNYLICGIQSVIFIVLCLITSEPIVYFVAQYLYN